MGRDLSLLGTGFDLLNPAPQHTAVPHLAEALGGRPPFNGVH